VANTNKRRSLAEAFGNEPARRDEPARRVRDQTGKQPDKPATNGNLETVPGKGGNPVSVDSSVNMTFTVTAKERYLWTLELKRRGVSAVSVLRRAMNELLEGDGA
jgi:hypothetical protein